MGRRGRRAADRRIERSQPSTLDKPIDDFIVASLSPPIAEIEVLPEPNVIFEEELTAPIDDLNWDHLIAQQTSCSELAPLINYLEMVHCQVMMLLHGKSQSLPTNMQCRMGCYTITSSLAHEILRVPQSDIW